MDADTITHNKVLYNEVNLAASRNWELTLDSYDRISNGRSCRCLLIDPADPPALVISVPPPYQYIDLDGCRITADRRL